MTDPLDELKRVRDRLNAMERAIAEHYAARPSSPPKEKETPPMDDPAAVPAPKDRKTRDLENAATFYSPTEEAGFRQRAKDPERYDRDLAAMGGNLLEQALALAGREAHIKLGRALPTPEED